MLARLGAQSVIHFKRTKMFDPQVYLSSHQYPKNGLLAGFGWGFHPNIILSSQQKIHLYMLQGPRIKTLPNCSLRLSEYEINCRNFK